MAQDPLTLYKLITLYMLDRVSFPLTKAQIGDFILGHDYTNFLTLQQVIAELIDAELIRAKSLRNRTYLEITEEGRNTLNYFGNRINDSIKDDIAAFLPTMRWTCAVSPPSALTTISPHPANLKRIFS